MVHTDLLGPGSAGAGSVLTSRPDPSCATAYPTESGLRRVAVGDHQCRPSAVGTSARSRGCCLRGESVAIVIIESSNAAGATLLLQRVEGPRRRGNRPSAAARPPVSNCSTDEACGDEIGEGRVSAQVGAEFVVGISHDSLHSEVCTWRVGASAGRLHEIRVPRNTWANPSVSVNPTLSKGSPSGQSVGLRREIRVVTVRRHDVPGERDRGRGRAVRRRQ